MNIHQNFLIKLKQKVLGKIKDVHKENPIGKHIGVESKMHCSVLDNGKELGTGKGVNTTTELMNSKSFFSTKKITRQKIRKIQRKKTKTWNRRNQQNTVIVF